MKIKAPYHTSTCSGNPGTHDHGAAQANKLHGVSLSWEKGNDASLKRMPLGSTYYQAPAQLYCARDLQSSLLPRFSIAQKLAGWQEIRWPDRPREAAN